MGKLQSLQMRAAQGILIAHRWRGMALQAAATEPCSPASWVGAVAQPAALSSMGATGLVPPECSWRRAGSPLQADQVGSPPHPAALNVLHQPQIQADPGQQSTRNMQLTP